MPNANGELGRLIDAQSSELAEVMVARQYELQPELIARYGEPGRKHSVEDVMFHLSYLSEALSTHRPRLFSAYMAWAKVFFAGIKLPEKYLTVCLDCMRDVLLDRYGSAMAEPAAACLAEGLEVFQNSPSTIPSFIAEGDDLEQVAHAYLDALLQGNRQPACKLILDLAKSDTPIQSIYLDIFQPCQREIGRLWQTNKITVAQEHYCTAATQLIMAQLYPYIFASERIGRSMVATSVSGELHEMGIRMVSDFFEMEGWDTFYLGASTPATSVLRALEERKAELLAISATIGFHIRPVAELIAQVRASESCRHVKILVGGNPFNSEEGLWSQLGADGFAPDARAALAEASKLVA
jgi:methanogenic corrinoid protein MtbC1